MTGTVDLMEKLLESPVIRQAVDDMNKADAKRVLAARVAAIEAVREAEKSMSALIAKLPEVESAYKRARDVAEQAGREQSHIQRQIDHASIRYNNALKNLKSHGETDIYDARNRLICEASQLRRNIPYLAAAKSKVPDHLTVMLLRKNGARELPHESAARQHAELTERLAVVEDALDRLASLEMAAIPPAEIRSRVESTLDLVYPTTTKG